jgi:hypothetical protein
VLVTPVYWVQMASDGINLKEIPLQEGEKKKQMTLILNFQLKGTSFGYRVFLQGKDKVRSIIMPVQT